MAIYEHIRLSEDKMDALHWGLTFTGKKFYPAHPISEDICIEDIAHALSLENRYGGHTAYPFSVAEHSIYVSMCLSDLGCDIATQLWGLLHDAPEAYLKDLPQPLKRTLSSNVSTVGYRYAKMEEEWTHAIAERFSLNPISYTLPSVVRKADMMVLAAERRDIFIQSSHLAWNLPEPAWKHSLKGDSTHWHRVEQLFLTLFWALRNDRRESVTA